MEVNIHTNSSAAPDLDAPSVPEVHWNQGCWLNKPKYVRIENGGLSMRTENATDFWRETHYGFARDSGHFLGFETAAEFTAQMLVRGKFDHLYDQAGFMLRADAEHWIKTGVEFTDGHVCLSTVVTHHVSDWSVTRLEADISSFWLRLTSRGGAVRIQASIDGKIWPLLRLAPFPANAAALIGPMACTPERAGLAVEFSRLTIGPARTTGLHDLS